MNLALDEIQRLTFVISELTEVEPEIAAQMRERGSHLRPAEARILGLLTQRKGMVVTKGALLTALSWDRPYADEAEGNVVKVHVCNIRRKLAEAGIPGKIETIHRVGYRWREN